MAIVTRPTFRVPRLALAVLLGSAATAAAFLPTKLTSLFGAIGTSHESITESAVGSVDAETFGARPPTAQMANAAREIAQANARVDDDQVSSAKHFDGENFAGGQYFIAEINLPRVIAALGQANPASARFALGQAMHSLQDFYSHSNWVELGFTDPNPRLGKPGAPLGDVAEPVDATCVHCGVLGGLCLDCMNNLVTSEITSGYYGGRDKVKPASFKCSHGGLFDTSAELPGEGINKDSGALCELSPHFFLHDTAAALATRASVGFLHDVQALVTPAEFRLLLGAGPSLSIVVDLSPGMDAALAALQTALPALIQARLGTPEEPVVYSLVAVDGSGVAAPFVTGDATAFIAAVQQLAIGTSAGCAAPLAQATARALAGASCGGDVFVFTDGASSDAVALEELVACLAVHRDAQVHVVRFGSCAGLAPALAAVAAESGGQAFDATGAAGADATSAVALLDEDLRGAAVEILREDHALAGTAVSRPIPVDSSLTRLHVSATGVAKVDLLRPDGTAVAAGDAGVAIVPIGNGVLFQVDAPAHGVWTAVLTGTGSATLAAGGEGALALTRFAFLEIGGEPPHEGFFDIEGFPSPGPNVTLATLQGKVQSATFELRARDGSVISQPPMLATGQASGDYTGLVDAPAAVPFQVYVTGVDLRGAAFLRTRPGTITARTVDVAAPGPEPLPPGAVVTRVFQVQNDGADATFAIDAVDARGFVTGVSPQSVAIPAGTSADVTVTLTIPSSAAIGSGDLLAVGAHSTTDPAVRDFARLEEIVGADNHWPDGTQAQANPATLDPLDHALAEVSITGVTDADGDAVRIEITGIMQDEPVTSTATGDLAPDGAGLGRMVASLRRECDPAGNGRVYTVFYRATDAQGAPFEGFVKVSVPTTPGGAAVDDGPQFDSTVP